MSWEVLYHTKKARLFTDIKEGIRTYVVSIGNGNKLPPDHDTFRRDTKGQAVINKSFWTYRCHEGLDPAAVKQGAIDLYEKFC